MSAGPSRSGRSRSGAPSAGESQDRILPNAAIVARREYRAQVRSRVFGASTLLLALLAVVVAFAPVLVRMADRGTTTKIAVAATDDALAREAISVMGNFLNSAAQGSGQADPYSFDRSPDAAAAQAEVASGEVDGALIATRDATGRISFTFYTGEGIGADRIEVIRVGVFAVAVLDWIAANRTTGGSAFQLPSLEAVAAAGPTAGGQPITGAEFASRRIVGIVFVILIFITIVIYGMWVAAGVVAEKSSRVMELLVSAASPRQLVLGKVVGIGLAGLTQYVAVLVPALVALLVEDHLATAILGPAASIAPSLAALSPPLIAAYSLFFVMGFLLYALIYAAAGSLVSRPEDLQVLALPLSLIAIAGYLIAVMALSGGGSGLIRFASYVPFWSPFVMLTRLTVGHVEPWEVLLSYGLLAATIGLTLVVAIRVYSAGVLLYGQRPGLRSILGAVRHGA